MPASAQPARHDVHLERGAGEAVQEQDGVRAAAQLELPPVLDPGARQVNDRLPLDGHRFNVPGAAAPVQAALRRRAC